MIEIPGTIPIRIHPIFWVLVLGIGYLSTGSVIGMVLMAGVILFSLLVHEFGHALTALFFRQKATISLVAFGGVTQRYGPPTKLWQDFLIVLNGPLAGFLLVVMGWSLQSVLTKEVSPLLEAILFLFIYVNLFWTIVNLLPVQPLDGGHLLRIVFEGIFGFRGIRYSLLTSAIISILASFSFFALHFLIAGIVFLLLGVENFRSWRGTATMTAEDYHHPMESLLEEASHALESGAVAEAEQQFRTVYEETQEGILHREAATGLARSLALRGQVEEPYAVLFPLKNTLEEGTLPFFHSLAYRMQDWKTVGELGKKAYQITPNSQVAVANAFAAADHGDAKAAVGWLQCAQQEGTPNIGTVVSSQIFDPIRRTEVFQRFLQRIQQI